MSTQPSNVRPHVKNRVVTAYPGEAPDDIGRVREGDKLIEYMPASTAPEDPRTGKLVIGSATIDKIIRSLGERTADEDELSQISTSAADTLGGATSQSVDRGIGQPVQGQSSAERHHNGRPGRKREGEGKAQFGPQGGSILGCGDR